MTTVDKDTIEIIINMKDYVVQTDALSPDGEISFDTVIKLAVDDGSLPSGPYIEYQVFYENSPGRPPSGRLEPGQSVKVHDGTTFNVTPTDLS